MKSMSIQSILQASFFLLLGLTARATQTDNHGIHAVPAPGPVTIDGKLDDWDLSGQVFMCYDIETLKDVYSAKVAAMYDADNLYLSVHWTDPNPMCNSHDPHYQANRGWAGDCVQFRFKTDRITNLDCWYYAANKEPTIRINYGSDLTHPDGGGTRQLFQTEGWKLTDGAEEAFVKDADGKGYVQEIKLPWNLITLDRKYQAGDSLNMGVELLWGSEDWPAHRYADNLAEGFTSRDFFFMNYSAWGPLILEPKGRLELPEPEYVKAMAAEAQVPQGPVKITYNLPEDALVTLAINDSYGRRIRNLIPAQPRTKGKVTEYWDGRDDDGKPVPAQNYNWKAIYHPALHTKYVMSFANPGNPTWDTGDGRGAFYADHTAAEAVATAGDYVALGCPIGEAGKPLIGCDLNGQRLWGLPNRTFSVGGRVSLATDGKILWVSQDQTGTIYRVEVATGRYAPWNRTATDASGSAFQVLDLPVDDPGEKTALNLTAIAVNDHLLAVCLLNDGLVRLLDKETGDVKGDLKVPEPVAAVFDTNDDLVVLSGDHLVRVSADGEISPFTSGSFPDGYGLAIDAKRNIYLSVRGAAQNVKVFSPSGQLSREIGKLGGRPLVGKFDAAGMRNPGQIAVDRMGRLWVVEETMNPKRTSVWNTETGELVKDLIGTTTYAGAGAIDPFDPTMSFSDDTVYRLDWDKGTYRPTWSLGEATGPDDLFPAHVDSLTDRVIKHGDATYVYTCGSAGTAKCVYCTMYRDGVWRSAAAVGVVTKDLASNPLFAGHEGDVFGWTDRNGDGRVQGNELTFARLAYHGIPYQIGSNYWGQLPDDQGTITYGESKGAGLVRFPVKNYLANGTPVYDVANPVPVLVTARLNFGEGMIIGGKQGRLYINQDPLTAFDGNGRQLFTYPNHYVSVHGSHDAPSARPGMLIGPSSFYGVVDMGGDTGEVFYLNGNLGENYLFTWDGLFVQSLFKDTRGGFTVPAQAVRGESFDEDTANGESFGGNFVRTPDGKIYLVEGGTDARVLEITGLDQIKRLAGSFTYTPEQFVAAQQLGWKTAVAPNAPKVYTIPRAQAPVVIDGKPDEWPELNDNQKPLIEIQESAAVRFGRVAARYDDKNLYLAYHVFSPNSEPRNSGQDLHLLFKTGDVVDLMLGPESQNSTGAGNLRLLFSVMGGQPTAVLYEKSVPGTSDKDQVPFSSPWRTIYFDRVTQPGDIKVAVGPYPGGSGYFVEAEIPWSRLGVTPSSGLKLKGDFGILFGDTSGTITVSRKYWSNKSTGLVNDVPGEAQLEPDRWGELTLQ
jgi:hypothetical protein